MNVKQDNLYVLVMQNASTMLVITLVNVKKVSMVMEKSALVSVVVLHWAFLEKNCTPPIFLKFISRYWISSHIYPDSHGIFHFLHRPSRKSTFSSFFGIPLPPLEYSNFYFASWNFPLISSTVQIFFFLEKPISYKFDCCFWNYFMIFCF